MGFCGVRRGYLYWSWYRITSNALEDRNIQKPELLYNQTADKDLQGEVGPHYKASTDKKANGTPKAGPAKITIIKQGALHPYHVIHTDGTSRVYGWVDASEISGKSGGSSSGSGEGGLKIRATITACNWHSDGKDEALDCGAGI